MRFRELVNISCGTVSCRECGEYMEIFAYANGARENIPHGYERICESCVDTVRVCEDCGTPLPRRSHLIYRDEDAGVETLCGTCHNTRMNRFIIGNAINSYNYTPDLDFRGEPVVPHQYFGLEVEIDGGGEDSGNARKILRILNAEQKDWYCMHDGSLSRGLEFACMPSSYEHIEQFPWNAFFERANELGYETTRSCGLHIHLDRRAFGGSNNKSTIRDFNIMKFVYLFEKLWDDIVEFSGRVEGDLMRWANSYSNDSGIDIEDTEDSMDNIYVFAKDSGSKYKSVNLLKSTTVEVRVFAGTSDRDTIMASVQLVKIMQEMACEYSLDKVTKALWDDVKARGSKYSEFTAYCQSIGL